MELTAKHIKKDIDDVSNRPSNPEKLAWRRKLKRMEKLVEDVQPYEEKILEIMAQKMPLMDKISKLRKTMVEECIHPKEYLTHRTTYLECKFCGKLVSLNKPSADEKD